MVDKKGRGCFFFSFFPRVWLTDDWVGFGPRFREGDIVFRAAHDSSKAMKVWMGDLRGKKK